jgi:dTDP-4-dehydrorhamnose reductase
MMNKNLSESLTVLVIGATGLIGSTIFKYLSRNSNLMVFGTIRNSADKLFFLPSEVEKLHSPFLASDYHKWNKILKKIRPNFVINCLGITKHLDGGNDPLVTIPINSYFPHYLNACCREYDARLIHISSDCVFSGNRGGYLESDIPDAQDFYGRSKALGEIVDGSAITLRTSTIGHELKSAFGLLNWFLGQERSCQGFKGAYFSGITTLELAKIIERYVIPNDQLRGLYHVGASKISKFDLLTQIACEYDKKIEIIPNSTFKIDRSFNSDRFYEATGYKSPSWKQLVKEMHLGK